MISVLSTTNKYILQPSLIEMHRETLNWLSASVLWKRELSFYQKLLGKHAPHFSSEDDKKKVDHFQNIIIYYSGELLISLQKKLRDHENRLATMLQELRESDYEYYKEHNGVITELASFDKSFIDFKRELFEFIETDL